MICLYADLCGRLSSNTSKDRSRRRLRSAQPDLIGVAFSRRMADARAFSQGGSQRLINTHFARPLGEQRQLLVYARSVELADDVARTLPIPAAKASGEDAVDRATA